jgi:UDP-N-acetylmuramyl pentapeptide phosphotransferase/UDP-N-acetylglucosamine-1-phosphate transferase
MASAVLAWWLIGIGLQEVDVGVIDQVLAITFFSVLITAIAIGGVANAINIIDGFHGLAGGVTILIMAAFALIAYGYGDVKLMLLCLLLASVLLGFLIINTPFGKLFLGDGGAYLLGFFVGWVALLLPARNPEISPWASLLVCAYPVTEVLFSIVRRLWWGVGIGEPDRAHLHSLIKLAIVLPRAAHQSENMRNASVAPYLWLLAMLPMGIAVVVPSNTPVLMASFVMFFGLYLVLYRYLSQRAKLFQAA